MCKANVLTTTLQKRCKMTHVAGWIQSPTHRLGKGLPSKPVPCDYLKSASMGFGCHTYTFPETQASSHSVWTKCPPGQ